LINSDRIHYFTLNVCYSTRSLGWQNNKQLYQVEFYHSSLLFLNVTVDKYILQS